jgi:putative hydrolase of the HAD superfamily
MRSALLVDLDDTLYDEQTYVQSGFRHVAAMVSAECAVPAGELFEFLQTRLAAQGRGRLFDDLLIAHGLSAGSENVKRLVNAYRDHQPAIALAADVKHTLETLREQFVIGIVTDGLASMQRRKTDALGLTGIVDTIVYCWEHGEPKPSAKGFQLALEQLGAPPLAAVVGDNVHHDLPAAVALGAPFIRVRGGRLKADDTPAVSIPVVEVGSFCDVPQAIAGVAGSRTGAL